MPRAVDMPIPADERLFRAAAPEHVDESGAVYFDAIDKEWCSVGRERYVNGDPSVVVSPDRPRATVIIETTPAHVADASPFCQNGVDYEIRCEDLPLADAPWHAEIQFHRAGTTEKKAPGSSSARRRFQQVVASAMRRAPMTG